MTPFEIARVYLRAGLSVLPIKADGSKRPALASWKEYQSHLPGEADLAGWFGRAEVGIAVLGGRVSGNLEVLDFDDRDTFDSWSSELEQIRPGLLASLPQVETPAGGRHVYARIDGQVPGNHKLALSPEGKTLIETRGEGGYVLAPGSCPAAHPTGRTYKRVGGPAIPDYLDSGEILSADDRETMHSLARSYNARSEPGLSWDGPPNGTVAGGERPGDTYNSRTSWEEVLSPHGWRPIRHRGQTIVWQRPGKDGPGGSATTGHCTSQGGSDLLYVFSTSAAPFEAGKSYSRFAAHALLNHNGDYRAAARVLAGQGYGTPRPRPEPTRPKPVERKEAEQPRPRTAPGKPAQARPYIPPPQWQPFPVDALPPVLCEYVKAGATALGCDPSLVALPALATVASTIGNSRALLLKTSWLEPSCIWSMTLAPSGSHKSPAWRMAVNPLVELQCNLHDAHEADWAEYEEQQAAWQQRPKDERGDPPARPAAIPDYYTGDATIEALAEILRYTPRGTLVAQDELDAWFQSFSRYKGKGGGSDRANWLALNAASPLKKNRSDKGKNLLIRRALASITGTIQPEILAQALSPEAQASGLGARFLLAMPPRKRKRWTEATVSEELAAQYQQLLEDLLALELKDTSRREPHVLAFSRTAQDLWVHWYNEWADVQFEAEGAQAAAFAKLEGYSARLALVHHVVSCVAVGADDLRPVGDRSLEAAITLIRWFAQEALRVYRTLAEAPNEREARKVVDWVRERGGVTTVRDLQRSSQSRYPTAADAQAALDELVEMRLGCWETVEHSGRGRPGVVFRLLSTVSDSDTMTEFDDDEGSDDDSDPVTEFAHQGDPGEADREIPRENSNSVILSLSSPEKTSAEKAPQPETPPGNSVTDADEWEAIP